MSNTLTKADIVDAVYEDIDRPRSECKKMLATTPQISQFISGVISIGLYWPLAGTR